MLCTLAHASRFFESAMEHEHDLNVSTSRALKSSHWKETETIGIYSQDEDHRIRRISKVAQLSQLSISHQIEAPGPRKLLNASCRMECLICGCMLPFRLVFSAGILST